MVTVSIVELHHIRTALESAQAEFEQLMLDEEWFVTETVDLLESGLEIVNGHLGLHPEKDDDDDEQDFTE